MLMANTLSAPRPPALSLSIYLPSDLPSQLNLQSQSMPGWEAGSVPSHPPPQPRDSGGGRGRAMQQVCLGPPVGSHPLDPQEWGQEGEGALAARAQGSAEGLGQGDTREPFSGGTARESKAARLRGIAGGPGQPWWAGQLQQGKTLTCFMD